MYLDTQEICLSSLICRIPAVNIVQGDNGEESVELSQEEAKELKEDAPICVSLFKVSMCSWCLYLVQTQKCSMLVLDWKPLCD